MRILVDMDGVVVDLMPAWVADLNRRSDYRPGEAGFKTPAEITRWAIHEFFPALGRAEVYAPLSDYDFMRNLSPVADAPETLKALHEAGHEIVIVTSCKHAQRAKRDWLEEHLPWLDRDKKLVITGGKELIPGDVFIDDHVDNLKAWMMAQDRYALCFAAPHNAGWPGYRATNWGQVGEAIRLIDHWQYGGNRFARSIVESQTVREGISNHIRREILRMGCGY